MTGINVKGKFEKEVCSKCENKSCVSTKNNMADCATLAMFHKVTRMEQKLNVILGLDM